MATDWVPTTSRCVGLGIRRRTDAAAGSVADYEGLVPSKRKGHDMPDPAVRDLWELRRRGPWLLLAVAAGFGIVLVFPYLTLDVNQSRIDVTGAGHFSVLLVHIFTAMIALVLGPLQFIPRVRAHRAAHRVIGRCYLFAGVLPSACTAVPVALLSGSLFTAVSLTIAAALWLTTGAAGYRAARSHDYRRHREWMMRSYALTFLAVTARVVVPLILVGQVLLSSSSPDTIRSRVASMIPIGQTLGWMVNLAVAEVVIRRRRNVHRPSAVRRVSRT